MARRTIQQRTEHFGFNSSDPWALPALRLLFHVPRVFEPLVQAWEQRYPGTKNALNRLVELDFAAYQKPIIVDVRTRQAAVKPSRKVARFRTTARGKRLVQDIREDPRVVDDRFNRLTDKNTKAVIRMLETLDVDKYYSRFGVSRNYLNQVSKLNERTVRWWVDHLIEEGLVRELEEKHADVRELVPGHWRVTKQLCRQLDDVLSGLDPSSPHQALRTDFRLKRARFLDDVSDMRVGVTGGTDFDHDIEAQKVLSLLLTSPGCAPGGTFAVEPRLHIPVDKQTYPWSFHVNGRDTMAYMPDAIITELDQTGVVPTTRRNIIEYERHQTRRDGWSHIERFLGYLHTMTLPVEQASLRFVVDTKSRERTYVSLIEAFADYAMDYPERMPANTVQLAVSSIPRLLSASDALGATAWFRIELPQPDDVTITRGPVHHEKQSSPYEDYFSVDVM